MSKHAKTSPACLNCDHPLTDADVYCSQCGQENHDLHVPVKHLLLELVEGVLHFDTKFFQTAKLLLFSPGALTEEYNAGKRTKYVPPVRMYIFLSFIFFLLLSVHYGKRNDAHVPGVSMTVIKDTVAVAVDRAFDDQHVEVQGGDSLKNEIRRATGAAIGSHKNKGIELASEEYVSTKLKQMEADHYHGFKATIFKSMSYMMFLLMPFAALLISVAYRKQKRYYIDHLVLSVHVHCFAFLLLSAYFILSMAFTNGYVEALIALILAGYFFGAMKKVYKESIMRTIAKSVLVGMAYSFVLGITVAVSVVISVMLT